MNKKVILLVTGALACLFLLALIPLLTLNGSDEVSGLKLKSQINFLGLKHGAHIEFWNEEAPMLEGYYFFGKPSGRWIWHTNEGMKKAECDYSARPTWCQAFYEDGAVQEESFFIPQKIRHAEDLFFKKSKSQYESAFRAGELVGSYKQFYAKGQKKIEGQYEDGSPAGKWSFFRKGGELRETAEYSGNLFETTVKKISFYESGQQAYEGLGGNSLAARNRTEQVFYETGAIFFKMKLQDNRPSEVGFFDPQGNPLIVCDVDELGFFCGLDSTAGTGSTQVVEAFYDSGSPALKIEVAGGRLHGSMTRHYENGKVASIQTFDHGALNGDSFFYSQEGILERASSYENWKVKATVDYDEMGGPMSYPQGT